MSRRARLALFRAATALVAALGVGLVLLAFVGRERLTYSHEFEGSYGTPDDELGWRLADNASARLRLRHRFTGSVVWESRIHTNRLGFRDEASGRDVSAGGIVAIGDSWTFGYGVDHEQSYPAQLAALSGRPVANAGVPAYGAAAVLLLFERQVERLRPQLVVFWSQGIWDRSLCPASAAETLVPCFDLSGPEVRLVRPAPGAVAAAAKAHRYPGGALTAGHPSRLDYVLFARPRQMAEALWQRLTRARAEPGERRRQARAIAEFELVAYGALARRLGFRMLLLDPLGTHERAAAGPAGKGGWLVHVGPERWQRDVARALEALGSGRGRVPHDGHFDGQGNAIVAREVHRAAREAGILPGPGPVGAPTAGPR